MTFRRLIYVGSAVADVVLTIPALPERGGDVLASSGVTAAGGGFNVMAAAARQGLPVAYAGAHGTGPFATLVRRALAEEGIEVLLPARPAPDTGFVIVMVDAAGERTFLTSPGAEAGLTGAELDPVRPGPGDAVCLSGYLLVHPGSRQAALGWLSRLGDRHLLFFDPGPLAGLIPDAAMAAVLRRAGWLACNTREAALLTGMDDPLAAAAALARRTGQPHPAGRAGSPGRPGGAAGTGQRGGAAGTDQPGGAGTTQAGVVVRTGAEGCVLALPGTAPIRVPGYPVRAVDTTGAGDAHTGVFLAALAGGMDETAAARTANAAAAFSVTRRGPATAPAAAELMGFLSGFGR